MTKSKDISGQKFGKLVALEPTNKRTTYGGVIWRCLCDCGNEAEVACRHLIVTKYEGKGTRSCGCLWIEKQYKLPEGESSFNRLFYDYKKKAKYREIEFSLSKEEFKDITNKNCFYCGTLPHQKQRSGRRLNGRYIYNGVDRVDNNIGYIMENCVPCCGICNKMKRDISKEDFLNKIKEICENLNL